MYKAAVRVVRTAALSFLGDVELPAKTGSPFWLRFVLAGFGGCWSNEVDHEKAHPKTRKSIAATSRPRNRR